LFFVALLFIGTFFSLFLLEMLVHDHYHRKMDEIRQNEKMNQKENRQTGSTAEVAFHIYIGSKSNTNSKTSFEYAKQCSYAC
jgi:hypothetical protein